MKKFIFILIVPLLVGCDTVIFTKDKLIVTSVEEVNKEYGKYKYEISVPISPDIFYYSNNTDEFNIGDEVVIIKKEIK